MFKPATISDHDIGRAAVSAPENAAANVFRVLHGFYGNLFLSKFATGEVVAEDGPEKGHDRGVVEARRIWGYGLREFDVSTVKTALQQCMDSFPEFPPSFPQFRALCAANKPREVYRPAQSAIGMAQGLRSRYAAQARAINDRYHAADKMRTEGFTEVKCDLASLKQAIANAVATAGGDEARELHRLDVMFPRSAA